jgi:acetate CoA/acetoacetate CoA-transferase alpha subunit
VKNFIELEEAVSKIQSGNSLLIGGFIGGGIPANLLQSISKRPVKNLLVIANDSGFKEKGIGELISNRQVSKIICSHIGTNSDTVSQYINKEIEVEFVPQGSLIERIRAAGAGLGGILTPTGIGTSVEEGKKIIEIEGKKYLLELPLRADIALIKAAKADKAGNLYYNGTARNFNPIIAFSADIVIAEVDEVVEIGEIKPEDVHTSGIFIDYIVDLNS